MTGQGSCSRPPGRQVTAVAGPRNQSSQGLTAIRRRPLFFLVARALRVLAVSRDPPLPPVVRREREHPKQVVWRSERLASEARLLPLLPEERNLAPLVHENEQPGELLDVRMKCCLCASRQFFPALVQSNLSFHTTV